MKNYFLFFKLSNTENSCIFFSNDIYASVTLRNLHISVDESKSHFSLPAKEKVTTQEHLTVSCYLLAYIILLQKKPSYKFKVEESKLITDIYNKETDG